jgi:pSer/pThr/pTyr-binding forkhead associated (FHA) protein
MGVQRRPRLTLRRDGVLLAVVEIKAPSIAIGRRSGSAIQLDDAAASGLHAVVTLEPDPYLEGCQVAWLVDMGSTNGTWVNGERTARRALRHGDTIRIGRHELLFEQETGVMEQTVYLLPDRP